MKSFRVLSTKGCKFVNTKANHSDCRNFIPVDVAKGYCNLLKSNVLVDSSVCSNFFQIAKCKVCAQFGKPDEKGFGHCNGFNDDYWSFGELKATNCEMFQAK